jgi:uncharacterized Tic20 family protein
MGHLWVLQLLAIVLLLSPIVVLPVLFWWSRRTARKQMPRENGDTIEFYVTSSMRLMVRVLLFCLLAFIALMAGAGPRELGTAYALLIPFTVFGLILLVLPVPVVVDGNGIRQGRWFLPEKEIAWEDIASVAYGKNIGTTYVRSRNGGPKIRFSVFLVGRKRFMREIRAHTHEEANFVEGRDDD